MYQVMPHGALKFRKRKITIIVAICPKCGGDMWKKRFAKTKKRYECLDCNFKCEVHT